MGLEPDTDLIERDTNLRENTRPAAQVARWPMQSVRRTGLPPLRFAGRLLLVNGQRECSHGTPYFELWKRKAGGFVAAYAVLEPSGPQHFALKIASLDAVMDHLEEACAKAEAAATTVADDAELSDTFALALRQSQRAGWVRDFLWMAGEALDHIDRLIAAPDDKGNHS